MKSKSNFTHFMSIPFISTKSRNILSEYQNKVI
jgi:hypothetical protein